MSGINTTSLNIENKEGLFFVGQKYSEVSDERLKSVFEDLDLDGNKELSKEELEAFENYLKLKDENYAKRQKLDEIKKKSNTPLFAGGISGLIGGIAGAVSVNGMMKGIYNLTKGSSNWFNKSFFKEVVTNHYATFSSKNSVEGDFLYSTREIVGTPLKNGLLIAGGILAAGLAGYGIYKYFSNKSFVNDSKLEAKKLLSELDKDDANIQKLDEQYKHINIQEETLQRLNKQKTDNYTMDDALKTIGAVNLLFMMMDDDIKRQKAKENENMNYYNNRKDNDYNNDYQGNRCNEDAQGNRCNYDTNNCEEKVSDYWKSPEG